MLKITNPPSGIFEGSNFMTPKVLAFYKLNEEGAPLLGRIPKLDGMR